MNRPNTFKPDFGIEHPAARRASAAYWLARGIALLVVVGAGFWVFA